jgi:hypothetical protein
MTGRRRPAEPVQVPPYTPTHAQLYRDAVWDSDLGAQQKVVALCYANHARGTDTAWVGYRRLARQTGIRSHESIALALSRLVAAGWLEPPAGPRVARRKVLYRLTIPDETATGGVADWGVEDCYGSRSSEDPNLLRKSPNLLRKPGPSATDFPKSATGAVAHSLDSRDSLVPESQRAAYAAASLRAAASANGHPVGTLSVEEAKRQIRDTLKVARRTELWRWPRGPDPARPGPAPGTPGSDEDPEGPPAHSSGEGDPQ